MTNNLDYIKTMTPRARSTRGAVQDTGIKMIFGSVGIGAQKVTSFQKPISFGNYFNPDCKPVVIVTLRSSSEAHLWLRTTGLNSQEIDNKGFRVRGQTWSSSSKKPNKVSSLAVDWVAFGF